MIRRFSQGPERYDPDVRTRRQLDREVSLILSEVLPFVAPTSAPFREHHREAPACGFAPHHSPPPQ